MSSYLEIRQNVEFFCKGNENKNMTIHKANSGRVTNRLLLFSPKYCSGVMENRSRSPALICVSFCIVPQRNYPHMYVNQELLHWTVVPPAADMHSVPAIIMTSSVVVRTLHLGNMADDADISGEEAFYRTFLLEEAKGISNARPDRLEFVPTACYVFKTRTNDGEKVFINVCTSETMPAPKDISEEELAEILNSEDAMKYRVPLSLGEPHAEVDKSGKGLHGSCHWYNYKCFVCPCLS